MFFVFCNCSLQVLIKKLTLNGNANANSSGDGNGSINDAAAEHSVVMANQQEQLLISRIMSKMEYTTLHSLYNFIQLMLTHAINVSGDSLKEYSLKLSTHAAHQIDMQLELFLVLRVRKVASSSNSH